MSSHREREPVDMAKLSRPSELGHCFICEFSSGNPDYAHVEVYSDAEAVVFLDRHPTLFGKILVAPRRHVEGVTSDFTVDEYLRLQRLIYQVGEAVRRVLDPERVYILSLGSQAANAHVHWHIAPLPRGVPLEQQQYHALMHENGAIRVSPAEQARYADQVRSQLTA